jgi:hypothetical protein
MSSSHVHSDFPVWLHSRVRKSRCHQQEFSLLDSFLRASTQSHTYVQRHACTEHTDTHTHMNAVHRNVQGDTLSHILIETYPQKHTDTHKPTNTCMYTQGTYGNAECIDLCK